jgi:hypothetical protein
MNLTPVSGIPTERLQVVKMRMPNLRAIHWIHWIRKRSLKRKMNGWRWRDEYDEYNYYELDR